MIDVDHDRRERAVLAPGPQQLTRQKLSQRAQVVQSGQRIGDRLLLQVMHRLLQFQIPPLQRLGHFVEFPSDLTELVLSVMQAGARSEIAGAHSPRGIEERSDISKNEDLRSEERRVGKECRSRW